MRDLTSAVLLFACYSLLSVLLLPDGVSRIFAINTCLLCAVLLTGLFVFSKIFDFGIISYIRLWAVGFSGGVLAHSFNELAAPLPIVFAVIALVIGHLMNFSLGLIAILAHGVRLNLLEFSNHLELEWAGRAYDPFKKNQ